MAAPASRAISRNFWSSRSVQTGRRIARLSGATTRIRASKRAAASGRVVVVERQVRVVEDDPVFVAAIGARHGLDLAALQRGQQAGPARVAEHEQVEANIGVDDDEFLLEQWGIMSAILLVVPAFYLC
jgi:hypothetical protein